jgi:hypothetical protein
LEKYKIYIGEYNAKENPNANWTLIAKVDKKEVKSLIEKALLVVHQGLDVYLESPSGEVQAYFRDNLDIS